MRSLVPAAARRASSVQSGWPESDCVSMKSRDSSVVPVAVRGNVAGRPGSPHVSRGFHRPARREQGMHRDLMLTESRGKQRHPTPEVLHPNRRVRKNHFSRALVVRGRGPTMSTGILPPRRRAASRSISASRPMRTSAVFSFSPVYSPAWPSRSFSCVQ